MKQRGKRPAYQHYPGDEQRDSSVQMLTLAEFGLWRRMMNLMHDGEPYGHLTDASGRAIAPKDLARLVGEAPPIVSKALARLEELKVFSRTADGIIYSRRMVRDEHNRNVRAAGGPKSLENPHVPRPKDGDKDHRKGTFVASFGGSPASAVCGLQSASASPLVLSDGERPSKRSTSQTSRATVGDHRRTVDTAAPLRSLALTQQLADLAPALREFHRRFYGTADPERQRDVALQLQHLQRDNPVRNPTGPGMVRAFSLERLIAKSALVIGEGDTLRDRDKAIVVLLIKLGDTSDVAGSGQLPGQLEAKAALPSGPLDERVAGLIDGIANQRAVPTKSLTKAD